MNTPAITARCYCGHSTMHSSRPPQTVAFCHCSDCKRWTGSPAPAFAAFEDDPLSFTPERGAPVVANTGVERWNCIKCGSPIAATFDYLPDQTYVPLGLIDQADSLPAQVHCHAEQRLPWLHIDDDIERLSGSARKTLRKAIS